MNPLILIIRLYRMTLGTVFPPSCRFYPTCSDYAEQSITRHGILKGTYYSLLRILRCHPFHPGGYDPVK